MVKWQTRRENEPSEIGALKMRSERRYSTKVATAGERNILELMLMIVVIGITFLMFRMGGYKAVALNLFFLPIVLSGYYLGRAHAAVLAVFTALCVVIASCVDKTGYASYASTFTLGLALTVWACVLGLTAMLVGTLCDERAAKTEELHDAYIGVVEVLSKYLQSGNPRVKARSIRTAETAQLVADELKLGRQQADDVRVGALLFDLENVEVTTKLLSRAVDVLEGQPLLSERHTFLGTDLVHSLSDVLRGAVPLVLTSDDAMDSSDWTNREQSNRPPPPIGARIIHLVRLFDSRMSSTSRGPQNGGLRVVNELRQQSRDDQDRRILDALEKVVRRWESSPAREPTLV